MPPPNVDIVFVLDASESMQPCFDQLKKHLAEIIRPLQGNASKVRFGLVAQSAGVRGGKAVYAHHFLCGSGPEALKQLYSLPPGDHDERSSFFTDQPNRFIEALAGIKPGGNEETLIALDIALDFPFGSAQNTRRVIAVFSDEPLEKGVAEGANNARIPELIGKIQSRKIQLFAALPASPGANKLAEADQSELEIVTGGDGMKDVDFKCLLQQMGKSISVSTVQSSGEPAYARAVFGQDRWGVDASIGAQERHTVLERGESVTLNTADPLTRIHIQLNWTASVDLDLHAFVRRRNGSEEQVYFGNRTEDGIALDMDAGVGDRGGQNQENIIIDSLKDIQDVLFATKIFNKGGCFADYDGRVVLETNNGDHITVPLLAQQRGDWCVIARINNRNPDVPSVSNVNRVTSHEPRIDEY